MKQCIFVYGTLKRGLSNSHYLRGQTFVSEARTQPIYRLVNCGGYPGMYPSESGVSVLGEIWEVDEEARKQLDILEDVAVGLYELVPVELLTPTDQSEVWTYLYRWSIAGKLDAGDNWTE